MTSEENDAIEEAEKATEETKRILMMRNIPVPEYVHTIDGDEARHRCPRIAKSRAVVERVIGAMKDFLLLQHIGWISKQTFDMVYRVVVVIAAICNFKLAHRKNQW